MSSNDFNELIGFKTNARVRASVESIVNYPFHLHKNCVEIICVLNGNLNVFDSAVNYHLSEHEVYIFNSGDPHKILSYDPTSIILSVQFDKENYTQYFKNLKLAYFVTHSLDHEDVYFAEIKYLRFLMARLYTEYTSEKPSDFTLEETTKELIQLLFDHYHYYAYRKLEPGGYNIVSRKNEGQNEEEFLRIYRIADYIETNSKEKVSLSEIAKNEFLSTSYLSKYIKENIGITFSELLSIVRCSEAERQLALTNKSIEEIASSTGFANRSHFSTQFEKWFSKSPSVYRKTILSDLGNDKKIKYQPYNREFAIQRINDYLNGI